MENIKENDGLGFIKDASELRRLIAENPDLPIVLAAGNEASCEDYCYTYCSEAKVSVREILNKTVPWDGNCGEKIYDDRNDFKEELVNYLSDLPETESLTDEEFDKLVKKEYESYEKYWTKVILVIADN